MPCFTITTIKLELKNANLDLLKKALVALGHQESSIRINAAAGLMSWRDGQYDKNTGKLTVYSRDQGNQIKSAYSEQVVKKQAARFGWQVKKVAENKYQLLKR